MLFLPLLRPRSASLNRPPTGSPSQHLKAHPSPLVPSLHRLLRGGGRGGARPPARRSQHPPPRASRDGARPARARQLSPSGRGSRRVRLPASGSAPQDSRLRGGFGAGDPGCVGERPRELPRGKRRRAPRRLRANLFYPHPCDGPGPGAGGGPGEGLGRPLPGTWGASLGDRPWRRRSVPAEAERLASAGPGAGALRPPAAPHCCTPLAPGSSAARKNSCALVSPPVKRPVGKVDLRGCLEP